jgi:hypothetical protein
MVEILQIKRPGRAARAYACSLHATTDQICGRQFTDCREEERGNKLGEPRS